MKKILTRIFSVALALAMVLPAAAAAPQTARKANGRKALSEQKAAAAQALPEGLLQVKGLTPLTVRSGKKAETNGLSKVRTVFDTDKTKKAPIKVQKAQGQMPDIIGCLVYTENQERVSGVYTVPTAEGENFNLLAAGASATSGGVLIDDVYYATNYFSFIGMIFITVEGYNIETGELVYEEAPTEFTTILKGAAVDPTTNKTYCVGFNAEGNGLQLGTIEYGESAINVTRIAEFNYNTNCIAFDSNGQMYGVLYNAQQQGEEVVVTGSFLVKIDKTNGSIEMVGSTGLISQYISGGAIDPKTNRMFWTVATDEEALLSEIDLTTGLATPINIFPENDQIVGVQILPPAAEPTAPAAATNLSLEFPNGAMTGNVKFTAPTTLYDGTAASGELTYKVQAGDVVVEGSTAFGQEVSAEMTFETPGDYEFIVTTSNAAGPSPRARIKDFIGNGIPVAPKPVLAFADETLTLTWNAVTTSVDGGYIAEDAMTYTVKDAEGEVVADNLSATTWSTPKATPEAIETIYFTVTAKCNGISSAAGKSNNVVLGSIIPPYTNTFDTADDCAAFTVIDGNNDGRTWAYYNGAMRVQYHSTNNMDDWLISAPIKMEAGKAYYVSMDVKNHLEGRYPEIFELCWGDNNTAAAMTNVIIEDTEITSATYQTVGGMVVPEADGIYYIGLHGKSTPNQYYLYVDNFSIAAGVSTAAPGQATDLVITPAAYGSLFATVSFNAPAKTLGGADLESITKIEVARDGEVIATKTGVTPGAAVKVADGVDAAGIYEYSVTAYNEEGVGETATASAFIGIATPTPVTNLKASAEGNTITATWNAPATDIYGGVLAPAQVKYNVFNVVGNSLSPLAENISETSYSWTYTGEKQSFEELVIQAVTEGGLSNYAETDLYAVGPAYAEYHETFADGGISYILGTASLYAEGAWTLMTDEDLNMPDANGDNGFAAMKGQYLGSSAIIFTGKISLEGLKNPGVTLYTYNIDGDNPDINEVTISVCEPNTYDWKELKTVVIDELGAEPGTWAKVAASLADYENQTVQIAITATTKQYVYTMIDDVNVCSLLDNDLAVKAIAAPAKVAAGDDYTVAVTVYNQGTKESAAATVELYALTNAGYEVVATEACEALAADETTTVEFVRTMSPLATAEDAAVYYAKVVYDADEDATNNISESVTVTPVVSKLPTATDLKGEATADGNVLTWNEPDLTAGVPDATTEDFENAESWAHEYADWIFVDVDQKPVGGFQGSDIPGITIGETLSSWFVFDAADEGVVGQYAASFAAASGNKYIACLFRADDGALDDWAISPALNGVAQTISFKAKSYSVEYPDAFEIWWSTGSTDVNDFEKLSNKETVKTTNWTEYSFDLPEGAKRFAIRSCGSASFMLMLDDVTYIPGDAVADLTLVGYDIYRDGEKLNAEVVAETTYTDATAEAGKEYTYNVVAIYTTGASAPSAPCTLTTSALTNIFAGINISAAKGEIVITGAEGLAVQVVAVDGKVLFSGLGETKTSVAVIPGVYVVKAGDKVAKLIVR